MSNKNLETEQQFVGVLLFVLVSAMTILLVLGAHFPIQGCDCPVVVTESREQWGYKGKEEVRYRSYTAHTENCPYNPEKQKAK